MQTGETRDSSVFQRLTNLKVIFHDSIRVCTQYGSLIPKPHARVAEVMLTCW